MASYDEALQKMYSDRLTRFYRNYDEAKVASVPTLLQKYKGKYGHCYPALRQLGCWVKKKRNEQNQPQTHDLPTPASPAAGKAAAMSLEDLESELLAGYGEEEDEADEPYEAFSALANFDPALPSEQDVEEVGKPILSTGR